mgnify:CR=1 FL=1
MTVRLRESRDMSDQPIGADGAVDCVERLEDDLRSLAAEAGRLRAEIGRLVQALLQAEEGIAAMGRRLTALAGEAPEGAALEGQEAEIADIDVRQFLTRRP